MHLSEEQLEFLQTEFNLMQTDIEKMTKEKWKDIRERCFYIEADELLDMHDEGKDIDRDERTKRCQLAISIVDTKFSEL